MKKSTLMAVVLCTTISLSACSGDSQSSAQPSSSSQLSSASESIEAEAPSSSTTSEIESSAESEDTSEADPSAADVSATESQAAETAASDAAAQAQSTAETSGSKVLIAYFTRANNVDQEIGVDAVTRASFNVEGDNVYGNTEMIARFINQEIGGDMFAMQVSDPYPYDVDETIENVAGGDPRTLSNTVADISQYDTVFIGYPNWNSTVPEPVFKFLEAYDFAGKTIVPFSTHRGSQWGRSVSDLQSALPDSTFVDGFVVGGDDAYNQQSAVNIWLQGLGLTK